MPTRLRALSALLALALMLTLALEVTASEDPAHPTPWSGAGITRRNDGRAHNYYYRLPTRHPRPTYDRIVTLRVFGRGNGTVKATVQGAATDPTRTYVTCNLPVSDPDHMTETRASGVAGVAPYLQITVSAGVVEWSVMVEESTRNRTQHAPGHGTPTPTPTPTPPPSGVTPPVPGGGSATPWPAAGLSEAIPEGYRPVYYWRDVAEGTTTVDTSITTPFSATVTCEFLDPHAPPEAPFALWTVSHTGLGVDGRPATQSWTDTRAIPAGRYLVRVTRESASRQSSYTLRIR